MWLNLYVRQAVRCKHKITLCYHSEIGVAGTISWKIGNEDCAVVMFSLPYDFNLYSNWLSIGIMKESKNLKFGCRIFQPQALTQRFYRLERLIFLQSLGKVIYIPRTLNIDLIMWHIKTRDPKRSQFTFLFSI